MRFLLPLILQAGLLAQTQKVFSSSQPVRAITSWRQQARAALINEGYTVNVVQVGNDEKNSVGLNPAQTRLANNRETQNAAHALGIKEVLILNHKSGELSQVSSNEIRNQLFALIRVYKPRIVLPRRSVDSVRARLGSILDGASGGRILIRFRRPCWL